MFYSVHIPRCTHIKTNGTQCGSPALRGRRFCYFHKNWREQRVQLNAKHSARASITLPVLEDADSIQVALMQVLRLILAGQVDPKTAGLLLYGLQTASLNLRSMRLDPVIKTDVVVNPEWVRQTGVGDQAWCEEDFDDENEDAGDDGSNLTRVLRELLQLPPDPEKKPPASEGSAESGMVAGSEGEKLGS